MENLQSSPFSPNASSPKLRSFSVFADVMNAKKKFMIKLESSLKRDKKLSIDAMTEQVRKCFLKY